MELENFLKKHDAVADAGVVGMPDVYKGEVRHAFLRMHEGFELTDDLREELKDLAADAFAKDCIPHAFYAVDKLPKSRSGKISRQQLKTWVLEKAN